MGYNNLDRALIAAWHRTFDRIKDDPDALKRVIRRRTMPTYTRPLRSWSLVLRANDKRIDEDNTRGIVQLDAGRVRTWCAQVAIAYPGISMDDAAQRLGVNRTTIARWASPAPDAAGKPKTWWQAVRQQIRIADANTPFGRPGVYRVVGQRLMLEHELNRANPKRSTTRVWTPEAQGIDPGGAVWARGWGLLRAGLADQVPADFYQQVERVDRRLVGEVGRPLARRGPSARVWQWRCPTLAGGCGKRVYKLYLPMPWWTLGRVLGSLAGQSVEPTTDPGAPDWPAFVCQRCAGLVYESSERTSSPGRARDGRRRRVDPWDRLIKRISSGVLTATDVGWHGDQPDE